MSVSIRRNLLVSIDPTSGVPALNQSILAPAVLPIGVALGTAGYNNSVKFIPKGGVAPYSWSILSGGMPTGCTLNTSTGDVTGTPSAQGAFPCVIQITDSALQTTPASYVLNVGSGLFRFACTPTPAVKSQPYRYQVLMVDATGSSAGITYTVTAGALPAGVALSAAGVLSSANVTAAVGIFYFTVRGTKGGATLDVPMQIAVNAAIGGLGISINLPNAIQNMTVGTPVDAYITVGGAPAIGRGPYTWEISAGALPAGVTMDSRGHFTGVPTAATPLAYVQPTFKVTDRMGFSKSLTPLFASVGVKVNSTIAAAVRGLFVGLDNNGVQTTIDYFAVHFGDGSDGDITLDGTNTYPTLYTKVGSNYTQLRPVYANTVTFGSNVTLNTSGLPTFVKVNTDGSGATNVQINSNRNGAASAFFGITGAGGIAGVGATGAGGVGGAATPSGTNSNLIGTAGNGGQGGGGTNPGGIGGAAQTAAATVAKTTFPLRMPFLPFTWGFGCLSGGCAGGGGGGGGGSGALAGANGGAGGDSAGVLYWFSYTITTDGVTAWNWNANGSAGAAGTNSPGVNRGASAGGGGSCGGIVWIVCVFRDGPAVANAIKTSGGNGGIAGTGGTTPPTTAQGASSGFGIFFTLSTTSSVSIGIVAASGITGGVAQLSF